MAQAWQKNVYVIADYYYIPWALRFYNLLSYLKAGDTLILSLEFFQYVQQYNVSKIFQNILKKKDPSIYRVLALYSDYINSPQVPFGYKYQQSFFIHPFLLKYFWKMKLHKAGIDALMKREPELYSLKIETEQGNRYSVILPAEPQKICPIDPQGRTMVDNIFKEKGFKIRKGVQDDLAILKKIEEKGVKIFWSWPVAIWTKKNLLENTKEREKFVEKAENLIQSCGIELLTSLEDCIYPVEAQYEGNAYHVNKKYGRIHTEKLIFLMKKKNITKSIDN